MFFACGRVTVANRNTPHQIVTMKSNERTYLAHYSDAVERMIEQYGDQPFACVLDAHDTKRSLSVHFYALFVLCLVIL